jgi:cell wall-associated protease
MRVKGSILSKLFVLAGLMAVQARATTVAIIDSGVDYKHEALASNMWTNANASTTDDAGATYKDDVHGWNFADNNNQIIDYKYVGTFSQDCYRMIEVQGRILHGVATQEEINWYKSKKDDAEFLKEMQKFGNFIHGTHVSGITTTNSTAAKIVGLKLIPTETPGQGLSVPRDEKGNPMVSLMLSMLAQRQGQLLVKTGKYAKAVGARVANGSFGTSVDAVKPVVAQLVKSITGAEPSDAEAQAYAIEFVQNMIKEGKNFVGASPQTLFVFAAGNDGKNNDSLPVSPANVKSDNSIAVAATLGNEKLASFSNYGASNVEVAAPGVTIHASIPGNQYIDLSGTSMAAPNVTNIAAKVQEANPALNPAGVKSILMGTVDKKDWLVGKVKTGGIVNGNRAFVAAELSRSMTIADAIGRANREIPDAPEDKEFANSQDDQDIWVAPLPAFFQ